VTGKEYFTKEQIGTDFKHKAARLAKQLNNDEGITGLVWKTGRLVGNPIAGSNLTDITLRSQRAINDGFKCIIDGGLH